MPPMPVTFFSVVWLLVCLVMIELNAKPQQNDVAIVKSINVDLFIAVRLLCCRCANTAIHLLNRHPLLVIVGIMRFLFMTNVLLPHYGCSSCFDLGSPCAGLGLFLLPGFRPLFLPVALRTRLTSGSIVNSQTSALHTRPGIAGEDPDVRLGRTNQLL